jgi:8-oxo-dGTP pyrophosphatase MutT (NUDIX family)
MTIHPWRIIQSKVALKDKWMHLRVDEVETADGSILSPYYVIENPDWGAVIALSTEGKILLQEQYRHGTKETRWELPGGVIDDGESPAEGIRRELLEETGCEARSFDYLITLSPNPVTHSTKAHFFVARDVRQVQEQDLDAGEEIQTAWFSLTEVLELIDSGGFCQGVHLGAFFIWLQREKKSP